MSVNHAQADDDKGPSPRETELLEAAYEYVLEHGLTDMSLRPLATAIGSSPRVLLYLFESKEGLVRAILQRARRDELDKLASLSAAAPDQPTGGLAEATQETWAWLVDPDHRALLRLWVEVYARSLVDPDGPWSGFAQQTVHDWLGVLASHAHAETDDADVTLLLAVLRGALLDLLATGDTKRTSTAIARAVETLSGRA